MTRKATLSVHRLMNDLYKYKWSDGVPGKLEELEGPGMYV